MRKKSFNEHQRYVNVRPFRIRFFILFHFYAIPTQLQEINRRNRRIIKQTFDSDVLEINETSSIATPLSPSSKSLPTSATESNQPKKLKLPQSESRASAQTNSLPKAQHVTERTSSSTKATTTSSSSSTSSSSNGKTTAVTTETDDWESIFDENGECLNPKLIDEITANVGKVTITKPKNDYKCYQEAVNLDDEEFPHVLEVSNFPVEFKTQDLMMVFHEYKDLGFDIKWVDDTHALVVFSSSKIGMCIKFICLQNSSLKLTEPMDFLHFLLYI